MSAVSNKPAQKKILIGGGVGLLLIIFIFVFFVKHHDNTEVIPTYPRKVHGGACPGETKEFVQNDPYTRGFIEQGQKYKVVMNYYDCNPIKKGDLVLFSLSYNLPPFVRIVEAVAGDKFKLVPDKAHRAWNLLVNGEMTHNKTDKKPYFFGAESPPTLTLNEKAHKGYVRTNEVILLSSWAPGDNDSSIYGTFSMEDVLGKVVVDN